MENNSSDVSFFFTSLIHMIPPYQKSWLQKMVFFLGDFTLEGSPNDRAYFAAFVKDLSTVDSPIVET